MNRIKQAHVVNLFNIAENFLKLIKFQYKGIRY